MKRLGFLILLVTAILQVGLLCQKGGGRTIIASTTSSLSEGEIVAQVLRAAETADLSKLPAIPVKRFALPPPGIDVVRVRMQGTYTVNGIGTDTVELSGQFSCIHRDARPAPGQTGVSWDTAIVDTEFVSFDISGESKLFGPIHVYLNPDLPSYGQAGALNLPELSKVKATRAADNPTPAPKPDQCIAVMNLKVEMPQLNLKLQTRQALRNYSLVDTIPPVGTAPSFTLEPTELVSNGRVVGLLQGSSAKLREVVLKAEFNR